MRARGQGWMRRLLLLLAFCSWTSRTVGAPVQAVPADDDEIPAPPIQLSSATSESTKISMNSTDPAEDSSQSSTASSTDFSTTAAPRASRSTPATATVTLGVNGILSASAAVHKGGAMFDTMEIDPTLKKVKPKEKLGRPAQWDRQDHSRDLRPVLPATKLEEESPADGEEEAEEKDAKSIVAPKEEVVERAKTEQPVESLDEMEKKKLEELEKKKLEELERKTEPPRENNQFDSLQGEIDVQLYSDSHFFPVLIAFFMLAALIYIGYHNKRKLIALILEGRSGKGSKVRYHRLAREDNYENNVIY